MKHFLLKFNHGVEIGAALAYAGHYKRTKDQMILDIEGDEIQHQLDLEEMLEEQGDSPSILLDLLFASIGWCVYASCQVAPAFMLNPVARFLEVFAVFSYRNCAKVYPVYAEKFKEMELIESEHEKYFKGY
jgi:hypothetical protein